MINIDDIQDRINASWKGNITSPADDTLYRICHDLCRAIAELADRVHALESNNKKGE